jgi:hypothetical protein
VNFQIKKATKAQAKLRLAAFGPSGAGKTMTALRIATGLLEGTTKRIGVIDTERGSAAKYSDRWDFDVIELEGRKDVETVTGAISAFAQAGHGVLVIDSLTHAWQELLVEIDRLAKTRYKGNTWSAWSEGTPLQRSLVDAILDYPGHVIATMRSKTEWTTEKDDRTGKSKPMRVGLAPEQGKGIEYEFDMLMEISTAHVAEFIKDRTGKYQDQMIEKPGEGLGRELAAWLADGAPVVAQEAPRAEPVARVPEAPAEATAEDVEADRQTDAIGEMTQQLKAYGVEPKARMPFLRFVLKRNIKHPAEMTLSELARVNGWSDDQWQKALADYAVDAAGGPPEPDWSDLPAGESQPIAFDPSGKADRKPKKGAAA